ncbi:MAG: lipid A deacylase LpxR family protein [Alcanivorax sp.]|nr:lipid A deacylase LpxR family protein [Alcanivorax sp.]
MPPANPAPNTSPPRAPHQPAPGALLTLLTTRLLTTTLLTTTFFALTSLPAHASVLDIAWDNDLITGEDKGYTNGVRVSWLSTSAERNDDCRYCVTARLRDGLTWLPGIGRQSRDHAISTSVRQLMVTPENIEAEEPLLDDIPYVGLLMLEATLYGWDKRRLTGYGINIGIVGPDSGARRSQEWVHKVTGSTDPNGWDNQLGPDVVGGIHALHAHRFYLRGGANDLQNEFVWSSGVQLDNFITSAEAGIFWRMGKHLPGNFVPEYAGMSTTIGLPGLLDATGTGWSIFAGLLGEGIAYNYIEKRGGDYSFTQRHFVGHLSLGAAVHTEGFQAALTLRATTAQEQTNKDPMTFGTISLTWRI